MFRLLRSAEDWAATCKSLSETLESQGLVARIRSTPKSYPCLCDQIIVPIPPSDIRRGEEEDNSVGRGDALFVFVYPSDATRLLAVAEGKPLPELPQDGDCPSLALVREQQRAITQLTVTVLALSHLIRRNLKTPEEWDVAVAGALNYLAKVTKACQVGGEGLNVSLPECIANMLKGEKCGEDDQDEVPPGREG